MFDTGLKGSDLTTSSSTDKTFYIRHANVVTDDESCDRSGSVNRAGVGVNQFRGYPVKSALDPQGSGQCSIRQYLQPDFDNQFSATATLNTKTNDAIATDIDLANTIDEIHKQSSLNTVAATKDVKQFATSGDNTIKSLQNILWNPNTSDIVVRKRQNLFQAIVWGGVAISVLGVAVATSRKIKK